jgi:hypothetical protein
MNIVIRPLDRGRFAALLGQHLLCESPTPLLTSARILQGQGIPAGTVITMTHEGSSVVSLTSTIGEAARLTVRETETEGPVLKPYRPPSIEAPRQRVRSSARTATNGNPVGREGLQANQLLVCDLTPCDEPPAIEVKKKPRRRTVRSWVKPTQLDLLGPVSP